MFAGKMKRSLVLIPLILVLMAACVPQDLGSPITAVPTGHIPTSIALTVEARTTPAPATHAPAPTFTPAMSPTPENGSATVGGATPTPTSFLAEAIPTATPSRTLRFTPSPTPTAAPEIPLSEIEISVPGALSKVISPIPIRALLVPGDQGRVTIELLGEDGRVLSRQIVILNPNLGRKAGLVIDLAFEIPSEAELGRLVVFRQDAAGRTTALSSVELVLLSSGQADYNAVIDLLADVVIQDPLPNALIQGGSLVVTGLARPSTDLNLVAELITESGQVVGQRVFNVARTMPPGHMPFIVEIPFNVSEPTWVLLVIRERGERIPGITYLTSTEVLLSP